MDGWMDYLWWCWIDDGLTFLAQTLRENNQARLWVSMVVVRWWMDGRKDGWMDDVWWEHTNSNNRRELRKQRRSKRMSEMCESRGSRSELKLTWSDERDSLWDIKWLEASGGGRPASGVVPAWMDIRLQEKQPAGTAQAESERPRPASDEDQNGQRTAELTLQFWTCVPPEQQWNSREYSEGTGQESFPV